MAPNLSFSMKYFEDLLKAVTFTKFVPPLPNFRPNFEARDSLLHTPLKLREIRSVGRSQYP